MLNAVRRGPASVAALSISSLLKTTCPSSTRLRSAWLCTPQIAPGVSRRNFQASLQCRRAAAAIAALEDEAVEADVEQELKAQRPPSDSQLSEAVRHGPVTKFEELVKRDMVCQTVVDTLTKDMRLETMTQVQSMTINETLKGIDV